MQFAKIMAEVFKRVPGEWAGKAAIDIALMDWVGKKLGIPAHWREDKRNTQFLAHPVHQRDIDRCLPRPLPAEPQPSGTHWPGESNDRTGIARATEAWARFGSTDAG